MKKKVKKKETVKALRAEAEDRLALISVDLPEVKERAVADLIHELRVHQIELEMQNEELRTSRLELEETKDKYVDLYDFAPVGYFTFTHQALIKEVNLTGASLFGVDRLKLINKRFRSFVVREHHEIWDRHLLTVLGNGGGRHVCELKLKKADGTVFYCRIESLRLDTGSATFVMHSALSDISAQKEAEEALRVSYERYRSYIELTGHLGWTTNTAGEVVEDLPSWRKFTGQTYEEIKGWGWTKALHPDDLEHTLKEWKKALKTKSNYEVEYRVRRHDGVYRHFMARGVPVLNKNGSIGEWLGTCIDITERKETESELLRLNTDLGNLVLARTRLYSVLAEINAAIVRVHDQQSLFEEVCRILVETGSFRLAWVGILDPESRNIRPVASIGESAYLEGIKIIAADVPEGRGPTGIAVREDHYVLNTDFETDPKLLPWREKARAHGLRSSSAFPLHTSGRVMGALMIYSDKPAFFTDEEIGLLNSLAENISFALDSINSEMLRAAAEDKLRQLNEELENRVRRRTDELQLVNAALRDSRKAAIHHMEEAVVARERSEEANVGLQREVQARIVSEEKLRASETKYRALFDNMINGFAYHRIILDEQGRPVDYVFLEVNDAFERLTGLKRDDIIGKSVREVMPGIENEPADWIGPYGKVALTGNETRFEQYSVSLNKWYSVAAYSPVKEHFVTIFEDITERKQVEEALRQSREDLSRAQEVGNIGSWRLDVRQNVLTWSDESHRIFGIPKGTPLTYEAFLATVHPEDRAYVDTRWKAALRGEPYDIEHRIVTDGLVKWVREKAYLEFDRDGSLLGGFGITQDITMRREAEEVIKKSHDEMELRVRERTADLRKANEELEVEINERRQLEKERARLVAAVECDPDGIAITDTDWVVLYVNPAFRDITGYSREEIIGHRLRILRRDEQDDQYYNEIQNLLTQGKNWNGLLTNRKKDGTPYKEEVTFSSVKDSSGTIQNYVAVKRDITDKLRLESIAEAVNTMNNIGYVFSGIRHEIGNPINSIKMTLGVLKRNFDKYNKADILEYIERALSESSRVEYLLKTLKNFNMYETPELQNIDLRTFFDKFGSLIKGDLSLKKGIDFRISIEEGAEFSYADPRALQQILLNICNNAADALEGRPGPRIEIEVTKLSDMILIHVKDNGAGISRKEDANLFKPFYTTKVHGTGLGLVIVKKMLAKMNGIIEIHGEKNVGTTVDIMIPGAKYD